MTAGERRAAPAGRRRRLGVIGSFVWDVIHGRDARAVPVEEWGGITYALGALDAALPEDWEIVPVMKVGADLAPQARDFLQTLRRLAPDAALVEVPYPNNRVELRYFSDERRSEVLRGGVPGWSWLGLTPLLRDLDALYVNLISGFELDLETAQLIRQHFRGPIYCDLHSLVLAVQPSGLRTPRPLPNVADWCRCFDLLQVNEDELAMMAPDPLALAATAMAAGVRCLVVTLGSRGAVYFAAPDFERLADVSLSIVAFRYAPPALRGDDAMLDQLNKRIMEQLQHDGAAFVTNTLVHGRFALRACILHPETTSEDLEALLEIIRASG